LAKSNFLFNAAREQRLDFIALLIPERNIFLNKSLIDFVVAETSYGTGPSLMVRGHVVGSEFGGI
jgi:hypothetical protein